ncbi:MAG: glutamine amidotransferase [Erysipelothrix sp.]|nr:glutamine amidotransferase [Erysipelothrix sp.]
MKIEILFPEVCSFFGDHGNVLLLEKIYGEENTVKTPLNQTPYFIDHEVELLYLGSMSESMQVKVLEILKRHKALLMDKIEQGMKVLFTGTAADLCGRSIIEEDGSIIEGLGIFDFETTITRIPRLHVSVLGTQNIVGHKTQFTQSTGDNSQNYFIELERGFGLNHHSKLEGFRYKNLIATNLTGPLLVLNPGFTKEYLQMPIPFEETLNQAHEKKVKDVLRFK